MTCPDINFRGLYKNGSFTPVRMAVVPATDCDRMERGFSMGSRTRGNLVIHASGYEGERERWYIR